MLRLAAYRKFTLNLKLFLMEVFTMSMVKTQHEVARQTVNLIGQEVVDLQSEIHAYLSFMTECVERVQNGDKAFSAIVMKSSEHSQAVQKMVEAQEEVKAVLNRYIESQEAEDEEVDRALAEIENM